MSQDDSEANLGTEMEGAKQAESTTPIDHVRVGVSVAASSERELSQADVSRLPPCGPNPNMIVRDSVAEVPSFVTGSRQQALLADTGIPLIPPDRSCCSILLSDDDACIRRSPCKSCPYCMLFSVKFLPKLVFSSARCIVCSPIICCQSPIHCQHASSRAGCVQYVLLYVFGQPHFCMHEYLSNWCYCCNVECPMMTPCP